MKFNIAQIDTQPLELKVGNVYPSYGGKRCCNESGAYWVVIALNDVNAVLLKITHTGDIVGAQTYGRHVFDGSNKHWDRNKSLLGHCKDLEGLSFNITWGAAI